MKFEMYSIEIQVKIVLNVFNWNEMNEVWNVFDWNGMNEVKNMFL